MYKIMALISVVVRQFYLPNPFEALEEGLEITLNNNQFIMGPECLNLVTEPLIHIITFAVVGLYYERGSAPVLGSLMYLFFYCMHAFILWLMSLTSFTYWAVLFILVIYICFHVALRRLWLKYVF